jgi:molybdopterin/thiamine biosynthesis adenylyltransferase
MEGRRSPEKLQTSNELCGAMLGVLIASEAFNRLIGPTLGKKQFQSEISLSLLTYTDTLSTENAELTSVDLPWAALIGCGAVGNAMIYALASLPSVSGQLEIIDPDWFTKTNAHRYMLSALDEQEVPRVFKTTRAQDFLAHHQGLKVTGYKKTFQKYLEEDRPDRKLPLIISAVDNFAKRRDLGREVPQEAINASTGQFSLLVSTHYAAYKKDSQPCVGCHYPHLNAEQERVELIARETGLSIQQVKIFSRSNEPMKKETLEQIALHRQASVEDFTEFEGQPFDSLYQHGICGGSKIETSDGSAEIPLAQVSAAAGVLLAIELVKRFLPALYDHRIQNFLQLDMLNLSSNWFMQNKPARANCDCGQLAFQKRYSQKYDEL